MRKTKSAELEKVRAKRQLKNINVSRVSIVDAGANLEPDFAVVKRDQNEILIEKGANMSDGEHVVKLGDKELVLVGKKDLEAMLETAVQKGVALGVEEGLRKAESAKKVRPLKNVACGAMVKQQREALKLNKADLAGRLGISEHDLTAIEDGESVALTAPLTKQLAAAIRVNEQELAGLLVEKSDAGTGVATTDEKTIDPLTDELLGTIQNLPEDQRAARMEALFSIEAE